LTIENTTIDVSSVSAFVTFKVSFADKSGLADASIVMRTPTGGGLSRGFAIMSPCTASNNGYPNACLDSGNLRNGVLRVKLKVAAHSPSGQYIVYGLFGFDSKSNFTFLSSSDSRISGGFTVIGHSAN
jgi:hypothetical protein